MQHSINRLVLHGVRDVQTFQEYCPDEYAKVYGWWYVTSHPLNTLESIIESCRTIEPTQGEGYVVCDGQFNRVKVKSPQYVALSHIKDSFSTRRLLDVIRNNEGEEFLAYFPEWSQLYHEVKIRFLALRSEIAEDYEGIKHIETQKDFALQAMKRGYYSILFSLRKGSIASVEQGLREIQTERLEQLLRLHEVAR